MPVEILGNALKLDLDMKRFRNKNKHLKIVGIDATSSPGNKTLQLGELCDKVYAFERDTKRAGILNNRVSKAIFGNEHQIECLNLDFIESKVPGIDEKTDEVVKFIVCDPSCSGSGMRLHTATSEEEDVCTIGIKTPESQLERVKQLSKFQYKILCHALQYDTSVKYVSYSTCSIYPEEDEQLVKEVLKKDSKNWRVVPDLKSIVEKTLKLKKG